MTSLFLTKPTRNLHWKKGNILSTDDGQINETHIFLGTKCRSTTKNHKRSESVYVKTTLVITKGIDMDVIHSQSN